MFIVYVFLQKMLGLIGGRLERAECDDVMEIAWSTMWNVTDETPENCEKFLAHGGMVLFLRCLQAFPNKPELFRNMMGLLGNVAEVPALRSVRLNKSNIYAILPIVLHLQLTSFGNVYVHVLVYRVHLMTEAFIAVFYKLLDSNQDNLEVSYNAAGVLARILSDGEEGWTIPEPDRKYVRSRMKSNIQTWNINSQRNIHYT
jgi:Zyg-11 family protein